MALACTAAPVEPTPNSAEPNVDATVAVAVSATRAAVAATIKAPINHFEKGDDYRIAKQYENAIQEFNEAIRIEPDYVHAYQNRGVSYYFLDQYETAIADFTKAIRLDPDNALAYASEDTLTPS